MIDESYYWKTDLLKQGLALKRRIAQKRWNDTSLARCEQSVMIGFYSVRKLIDSRKLTNKIADRHFQLRSYPPSGKTITWLNNHKIDELYHMDRPKPKTITLRSLCNQLIHSYVFSLVFEEEGHFGAILVASEYERSKALIEIPASTIIEVFEAVGNDDVTRSTRVFNPAKNDYDFKNE